MWKILTAECKAVPSHFTLLGTNSSNFYETNSKPNLVSTLVADLPEEFFKESIEVLGKLPLLPAHQPNTKR